MNLNIYYFHSNNNNSEKRDLQNSIWKIARGEESSQKTLFWLIIIPPLDSHIVTRCCSVTTHIETQDMQLTPVTGGEQSRRTTGSLLHYVTSEVHTPGEASEQLIGDECLAHMVTGHYISLPPCVSVIAATQLLCVRVTNP